MIVVSNTFLDLIPNLPSDTVVRINLAWVTQVSTEIEKIKNRGMSVLLDYPNDRKKPPACQLAMEDVFDFPVEYLAVSNFDVGHNGLFEDVSAQIVPKIETRLGVENLSSIVGAMPYEHKLIMLDHDDLYLDCGDDYKDVVLNLQEQIALCEVDVLVTQGVLFKTIDCISKFCDL